MKRTAFLFVCAAVAMVFALMLASESQAATYSLRPNSDVTAGWTVSPSGTRWAALDDAVTQPTSVDSTDYIFTLTNSAVAEVGTTDQSIGTDTPALSRVWYYDNTAAGDTHTVGVYSGGVLLGSTTTAAGSGFAWRSATFTPTAGQINDLQIRFTNSGTAGGNVRAAYIELNTTAWPAGTQGVACGSGFASSSGVLPTSCWRPYADSSPFNTLIPGSPTVHSNSTNIITKMLGWGAMSKLATPASYPSAHDWGVPIYFSQASDPLFTINCTDFGGACEIDGLQIRIPDAALPAHGGYDTDFDATFDDHMTVVYNGDTYDMWHAYDPPSGGGTLNIGWGGSTSLTGDGRGTGGIAGEWGSFAGVIRPEELNAGIIEHALIMIVHCTNGTHVYPAGTGVGRTCSSIGESNTNAPAMGQFVQLNMTDSAINALGFATWKTVILKAWAHYGAFVGDTGGAAYGFRLSSGEMHTTMGLTDPFSTLHTNNTGTISYYAPDDVWVMDQTSGWTRSTSNLRVLDPCVPDPGC